MITGEDGSESPQHTSISIIKPACESTLAELETLTKLNQKLSTLLEAIQAFDTTIVGWTEEVERTHRNEQGALEVIEQLVSRLDVLKKVMEFSRQFPDEFQSVLRSTLNISLGEDEDTPIGEKKA